MFEHFSNAKNGMLCSLGLHPWYLQNWRLLIEEVRELALASNVLAIGECGLDKVCDTDWNVQVDAFCAQVKLANELLKPLIIHCVKAYSEVVQVLEKAEVCVPVIFHGFNRNWNVAEQLLSKGYYLSVGAAVMRNEAMTPVVKQMPADRFFCETDDAEVPVQQVYQAVASVRQTTVDDIVLQVESNFNHVFKHRI